jgi:hypothetical protein
MPNILKGRHTSDFSNKGHCKNTLSNGSVKSEREREADRKYSVVMVGSGGVGNIRNTIYLLNFREIIDNSEICL